MFATRLITVAIALPLFAAALLLLPQHLWALVLLPALAMGGWEWGGLAGYRSATRSAYAVIVVASALLLYLAADLPGPVPAHVWAYVVSAVFWVLVAPLWLRARWAMRNAFILGVAGWIALVPLWLALVRLQANPWMLLLFLSIVWIADTAAYLAGKRWGRNKLAPVVSPGKTWEGLMGAAAAVAVYYAALSFIVPAGERVFDGWAGLAVFAGMLALSVIGDLYESLLKRQAGVKDSGSLLPGHGGVLDRIDGLTSTIPAAALVLYLY